MRCSRRSVLLHGRELVERDLQWGSCCLAIRTGGIGSTTCHRKRICGLHLLPGTLSEELTGAGIQQREAPTAGRAPMDEHQFEVEGVERPYVRPRSYWEAQRISQHLVI